MNKASKQKGTAPEPVAVSPLELLAAPVVGQVLAIAFGLLFLFQCMILPLVGKAAMNGSGSPGAERAAWAGTNTLFFTVMLLVTLAAGALAFLSKWKRRQMDGSPYPWATAGMLAVTLGILLAQALGLLKI